MLNLDHYKRASHTVNTSILTDQISGLVFEDLKKELFEYMQKTHRITSLKDLCKIDYLFEPFNNINNPQHSLHAIYIGHWSENFLKALIDHGYIDYNQEWRFNLIAQKDEPFLKVSALINGIDPLGKLIGKAFEKTHKEEYNRQLNKLENKSVFFCQDLNLIKVKLINEDTDYLESVVNHFKNKVYPNIKNYISRDHFNTKYPIKSNIISTITGWEIDYYDETNSYIVELKFHQKKWDSDWLIQALLYAYLINLKYEIKSKGVCVFNTQQGIKYTLNLESILGNAESIDAFYNIFRKHISDNEQISFKHNTKYLWDKHTNIKDLTDKEIIGVFKNFSSLLCTKYISFLNYLKEHKDKTYLDNHHNLWALWETYIK